MSLYFGATVFAAAFCGMAAFKENASGVDVFLILSSAFNLGIAASMAYGGGV